MVVTPFLQKLGVVCPDLWLSLVVLQNSALAHACSPGLSGTYVRMGRGSPVHGAIFFQNDPAPYPPRSTAPRLQPFACAWSNNFVLDLLLRYYGEPLLLGKTGDGGNRSNASSSWARRQLNLDYTRRNDDTHQ